MKRYPDHLVRQARRLSIGKKLSYIEIARRLGVSKEAISIWCRDLGSSRYNGLITYNQKVRDELFESEKKVVNLLNVDTKLLSAILYGCEGAKYPATAGVSLANSDPNLIKAFVSLMRSAFTLDNKKWRVHLQIHTDQNFDELRSWWSNLLRVPTHQFFKPTITSARGGKHRNEYFGTCSIRYGDYRLQLKLIGIFSEFLRKSAS